MVTALPAPTVFVSAPVGNLMDMQDQLVKLYQEVGSVLMSNKRPGDIVTLTIIRDQQQKEVLITLGKHP